MSSAPSLETVRCQQWRARLAEAVEARTEAVHAVVGVVPAIGRRIADEREAVRERAERERMGTFSRSVLVVDDDPHLCQLYLHAIELQIGVPVHVAASPAEARTQWWRHRSAVVLMDMCLGSEETGDQVLAGFPAGVRRILLSGWTDAATLRVLARNVHAVAMRKPVDMSFVEVVRGLLDDVLPPYWCHLDEERVVAVSPDLARLLGHGDADALMGTHWRALVDPEDIGRMEDAVRGNLPDGDGVVDLVNRIRRADGTTVRLSWDCAPRTAGVFHCTVRPV